MSIIKKLFQWLRSCFYRNTKTNTDKPVLPPIIFNGMTILDRPPQNTNVQKDTFYLIKDIHNSDKWSMFKCPCGCGHVITLSMQLPHNPHWSLKQKFKQRPSLYPSIWQDTSCFSHFWLKDGRIYWCSDSGTPPK